MEHQSQELAQIAPQATLAILPRMEAVQIRVQNLAEKDASLSFSYEAKEGNRKARAWVAEMRREKKPIMDAAATAQEPLRQEIKAISGQADAMVSTIEACINRHWSEIKKIEDRENKRIEGHKQRIRSIEMAADGILTSADAEKKITELRNTDVSEFEEFKEKAVYSLHAAITRIEELRTKLVQSEAAHQELEVLRRENERLRSANSSSRPPVAPRTAADSAPVAIKSLGIAASPKPVAPGLTETELELLSAIAKVIGDDAAASYGYPLVRAIMLSELHPSIVFSQDYFEVQL